MKKLSTPLIAGLLVLLLTIAYTAYLFVQKGSANRELGRLDATVLEYQDKLTTYREENIEQTILAKQKLDLLERQGIRWSKIIGNILDVVPKDTDDDQIVEILSYAGSGDNQISMNVKTVVNSTNPYFDVANFIESFDESEDFSDGFVPSIGSGLSPAGEEILNFTFTTRYVPEVVEVNSAPMSRGASR